MKKKFRKLISTCLAAVMLLSTLVVAPITAFAGETQAVSTGITINGDFVYELLYDGTAEITGYTGDATEVTIPSEIDGKKVTSIGNLAFYDCTSLTSITIPDSVTEIDSGAFSGCTSLESVTIPDSVNSIGEGAFFYCTSLSNIYVDSKNLSFTVIDGVLFDKEVKTLICYPIGKKSSSYSIPDSVTSIGGEAFSDCTSLTSITIPDSVTEIGYKAFFGCTSLTSITIPDGVTYIGHRAFLDCTSLTSITIPDSVINIDYDAFVNTAWYDNRPDGVVYAGKLAYCYKGVMPENTSITIKDGTVGIVDSAFSYWTKLTSITIPDSVTEIGSSAFYGCTSLTSITIPSSVKEIGSVAFGWYGYTVMIKIDGFTIKGYNGTAAETYANDNGFEFISLDEAPTTEPTTAEPTTEPTEVPTTEPTEPATVVTDKDTNVSVEGEIPEGVELNVESAEAVVENAVAAYNITLEKDGKAVQPDGNVTVKLPVPEGVDGSQCKVYYIDGDSKTDMNAVFVDGYLVFETDHFSVYAVVKTEKTSVLLGDVNGDGKVNINDATTIQKSAASIVTLTDEQAKAADVTGDGKVNVNDATAIQKFVAGIDTGFKIGE